RRTLPRKRTAATTTRGLFGAFRTQDRPPSSTADCSRATQAIPPILAREPLRRARHSLVWRGDGAFLPYPNVITRPFGPALERLALADPFARRTDAPRQLRSTRLSC